MKLIVPDAPCTLYRTAFDDSDLLDRKPLSAYLTQLVDTIEDPLVIAVDGTWGSGKSFFLQRWVGAHRSQNDGKAIVVYFDAFAHDYLDDPLIALVGVIAERFEQETVSPASPWKKGKQIVAKLWRPALRVGAALATGGVSELAGPVGDAAATATLKEIETASEVFWKREEGKRSAMKEFRSFLDEQTKPTGREEPRHLVVVVDELDRCRPDYALQLLETIKHFFAVANVHFVLGVNLAELENSVRARYGAGTSAKSYLQKFVTLRMQLPDRVKRPNNRENWRVYFEAKAKEMRLSAELVEAVTRYLARVAPRENLAIRDIQRLLSEIALIRGWQSAGGWRYGFRSILSGLVVLRHVNPALYAKARNGTLSFQEVVAYFDLKLGAGDGHSGRINNDEYGFWARLLDKKVYDSLDEGLRQAVEHAFFEFATAPDLREIIDSYIEKIEFT